MHTGSRRDTICLRCGYPISNVPKELYNRIKTCHMCRSDEENARREKFINKMKKEGVW